MQWIKRESCRNEAFMGDFGPLRNIQRNFNEEKERKGKKYSYNQLDTSDIQTRQTYSTAIARLRHCQGKQLYGVVCDHHCRQRQPLRSHKKKPEKMEVIHIYM